MGKTVNIGNLVIRLISLALLVVAFTACGSLDDPSLLDEAGRKPSGSSGGATIVASCNPCTAGDVVHFSGKGFDASQYKATMSFSGAVTTTPVWSDGTISHDWPYFTQPGTYRVEVYQKGKANRLELKASTSVTMQ